MANQFVILSLCVQGYIQQKNDFTVYGKFHFLMAPITEKNAIALVKV